MTVEKARQRRGGSKRSQHYQRKRTVHYVEIDQDSGPTNVNPSLNRSATTTTNQHLTTTTTTTTTATTTTRNQWQRTVRYVEITSNGSSSSSSSSSSNSNSNNKNRRNSSSNNNAPAVTQNRTPVPLHLKREWDAISGIELDDLKLLDSPAIAVFNAVARASKGRHKRSASAQYNKILWTRSKEYITKERDVRFPKPKERPSIPVMLNDDIALLLGQEGIPRFDSERRQKINFSRVSVATMLGLHDNDMSSIVRRDSIRIDKNSADTDSNLERIVQFQRTVLAHCVNFAHIEPYLGKLRSRCKSQQEPGNENSGSSSMRFIFYAVEAYARFGGAAHAVLEAHPRAAHQFRRDLKKILSHLPNPLQAKDLDAVLQISNELRQHVPCLAMNRDVLGQYGFQQRRQYRHLEDLYDNIHELLCRRIFSAELAPTESIRPPARLRYFLDILGGDEEMATKMQGSPGESALNDWASQVLSVTKERKGDLELDMTTVSHIVGILQEACNVFSSIRAIYMDILGDFFEKLMEHIRLEFPKIASEQLKKLKAGDISDISRIDTKTLYIAVPLLKSPSPKCQRNGIEALVLFFKPFAMWHFERHKAAEKEKEARYEAGQRTQLGHAFRSTMLPYDRPAMMSGEEGDSKHEIGLSLSHLGPLPSYKGRFVQRHISRGPVHGGALRGVYPLIVMVGPSGVGKSDLLEQLSKYEFDRDGTYMSNRSRLLLPLTQISPPTVKKLMGPKSIRQMIECAVQQRLLVQMAVASAIIGGHKEAKLPLPTPHDLFRYFNNGGSEIVDLVSRSDPLFDVGSLSVVNQALKSLVHEIGKGSYVCFAIDEVNRVAEMFPNEVHKARDSGSIATGNMLTAVAHALQNFGTALYTGTGLRFSDIEQSISAYGKDITVAGPAFPPADFRTSAFVLRQLINFQTLRRGHGANMLQCVPELYMLMGRMRNVEHFMKALVGDMNDKESNKLLTDEDGRTLPLSDCNSPEEIFSLSIQEVGRKLEHFVAGSVLPKILVESHNTSDVMKYVVSLALCGSMRVPGRPGDPRDFNSILVRCGLVQLSDESAHRSTRERRSGSTDLSNQEYYYFVNREPMLQYALARVLLSKRYLDDTSSLDVKKYIWEELVMPGNDAHQNGLELLTWMLLRAMSKDSMLHELIIGDEDAELGQYVNDTDFVWCDYPTSPSDRMDVKWLERLEEKVQQEEGQTSITYIRDLRSAFEGLNREDIHEDDMWFHLAHLRHSDPNRAYFSWRATVMPPQGVGPDIIGRWRHRTDIASEPLLVLTSCSMLPRNEHISALREDGAPQIGVEKTVRDILEKPAKDSASTLPRNMGINRTPEGQRDYRGGCAPLHDRRALRILVHPNLDPSSSNAPVAKLAAAYGLRESCVRTGRGRDDEGNFVLLLNGATIRKAIARRRAVSEPVLEGFPVMVLDLWEKLLDSSEGKMQ